jgi:hypothetical protein
MEPSKHVIDFKKRSAIKSQVLANFVVEWTEPDSTIEGEVPESPWLVYCDRAWGAIGAGAAAILISPSGVVGASSKMKYTSAQTTLQSMKLYCWGSANKGSLGFKGASFAQTPKWSPDK